MRTRTKRRAALPAIALLVLAGAATADDLRLGDDVAPTFQRVVLDLDPARSDYTGSVHVDLTVFRPTASFRLHAEEMELASLTLHDAAGTAVPVTHAPLDGGRVEVTAGRPLAPGVYSLDVDFANDFGTRAVGLYRAEHQGTPYLFTQFQAVDAREAFPVWDEPAAKIPYQLVVTAPAGNMVVTNTPEVARHETGGAATITFAASEPLPAYLLALAVGPFEGTEIEGMGVPGRILAPKGMGALTAYAAEVTPPILAALEDYFGTPYPYAKLDLLAVPEFWPGAMENAGLVTFADSILLVDPAGASSGQRRSLIRVNAHELAHMWFGDLVTMRWWDDLWLNESFADWMANKITGQLYPELEIDLFSRRGVQGIMSADARPTTEAIRQPIVRAEEAMTNVGLAYAKGRSVLGMVEHWLGEEAFRRGVVAYVNRHAGGNAVGADLWNELSRASGKDVAGVLASFLDQPGYPLVAVEPVGPVGEGKVRLSQRRFLNHGVEAPAQTWKVPLFLRWSDGRRVHSREVMLDGAETTVDLGGEVEWLLPDAGGHGYYRWRLPQAMTVSLAGRSAEALTPAERIVFLGNAAALLDAGTLAGDDYLRVLEAFADDPSPDVVTALLGSLGKVQGAFVPDDLAEPFAAYVRRTLRPALDRFGMQPRDGEPETVALFRPGLLNWLGDAGEDDEVLAYAERLARAYLDDPSSVDPGLAGTALSLAAKRGDGELFDAYVARFEAAKTPVDRNRFLGSIGEFEDPALERRALAYALEGPLRPTEMFAIPGRVGGSDAAADRVFDWFIANYDTIAASLPPDFRPFLVGVAGGCSAERLERGREFFTRPEREVEGSRTQLAKVAAQVEDCVGLRQREGDAVALYLRGQGGVGGAARAID